MDIQSILKAISNKIGQGVSYEQNQAPLGAILQGNLPEAGNRLSKAFPDPRTPEGQRSMDHMVVGATMGGDMLAPTARVVQSTTPGADIVTNPGVFNPPTQNLAQIANQGGRPVHQTIIENLMNNGDYMGAMKAVQQISSSDPYRQSMEALIKNFLPK